MRLTRWTACNFFDQVSNLTMFCGKRSKSLRDSGFLTGNYANSLWGNIMSKTSKFLILAGIAVIVAGCQSSGPQKRVSVAPFEPVRIGIQGEWRATEGPLLAKFSGNKFQSINTENNQVVAAGAFKYNSDQNIRLDWVGALSGRSSADCRLVNRNLMSCVPSNGSGFTLQRV